MELSDIRRHNSIVLRNLRKGDLVEFDRGLYSHWGVYIGDEQIVHLSGNGSSSNSFDLRQWFSSCGVMSDKAKVVQSNFWDVTQASKAKINNEKDKQCTPLRREKIVKKALSMLGDIGYNVLSNNCEHFASFCRYNIKWSQQADNFWKWVDDVVVEALKRKSARQKKRRRKDIR